MKQNSYSVCAVIVSYHPCAAMIDNLAKVRAQADGLVVVDNGSDPEEIGLLRDAAGRHDFQLLPMGENLGIAAALNRGIKSAVQRGFDWVILFDQDSEITPDYVKNLFACWQEHPMRDKVGSVQPSYVNPKDQTRSPVARAADGGPMISMTSGSLMPVWIFDKIGYFPEDYFIDMVDTEYCLRIRSHGYTIIDSDTAILHHKVGAPMARRVFGMTLHSSCHSLIRRYYYSRNHVAITRRYLRVFPLWCLRFEAHCWKGTFEFLLCEDHKLRKAGVVLLGLWDGITGRMGKKTL